MIGRPSAAICGYGRGTLLRCKGTTAPLINKRWAHGEQAKTYDTILLSYSHDKGLAKITLNKSNKKNAFSKIMYHELDTALRMLSTEDDVKLIMLTGSGDYYSSGNDLSNFSEIMHPLTIAKQSREICYSFVDSFISCKKPIVVAVNGPAFGIAVTTLGLCDKVFASSAATFKTPFAELGQVGEYCSLWCSLLNTNSNQTSCLLLRLLKVAPRTCFL
jgi:Delta3-Delta2-enoyl-CoA isomerase